MNVDAHVASLEQKHAYLEDAILEEVHRPAPDSVRLTELKREKLRIKEEIVRYSDC